MKTKLMDGSTPPTLIISQKYRNQDLVFRENRERRIGIDRVKDNVEKRLVEELETITHYNQLMKDIVNQVKIN